MCKSYLNKNSWWDLILDPALALKPVVGCHMPTYQDSVYIRLFLFCSNVIVHVSPLPDVTTASTISTLRSHVLFCPQ